MKIYIDENLPAKLAEAINLLQDYQNRSNGTCIEVVSIADFFGKGTKDEEWIPKVSGSYVITKDINLRKKKHQRKLYEDNNIGMFYISVSNISYWDTVKLIVRNWESILKTIKKESLPFSYKANGINNGFKVW